MELVVGGLVGHESTSCRLGPCAWVPGFGCDERLSENGGRHHQSDEKRKKMQRDEDGKGEYPKDYNTNSAPYHPDACPGPQNELIAEPEYYKGRKRVKRLRSVEPRVVQPTRSCKQEGEAGDKQQGEFRHAIPRMDLKPVKLHCN